MPESKGKKKNIKNPENVVKRLLEFKGPMEEYGKVTKMLGSGQVKAILTDAREVFGRIAGSLKRKGRKRTWINVGDTILLSHRSFQESVYDVIHRYDSDEVRTLIKEQEIPPFFAEANATGEVQDGIDFDDIGEDSVVSQRWVDENMIDKESDESDFEGEKDELGNRIG